MAKKRSFLLDIWFFAKALLRDRQARRRFMAQLLMVVMILLVLGNWPLREWVGGTPIRFVIWWGATFFLTIWMMLLAVYDAGRIRNEIFREDDEESR